MKKEIITCDVCGSHDIKEKSKNIQVIFLTEQDEGRASIPYLDQVALDLCATDWATLLSGKYLFAEGGMGTNSYHFKEHDGGMYHAQTKI